MSDNTLNKEPIGGMTEKDLEKVAGGSGPSTIRCPRCGTECVLHYVDCCARYICGKCGYQGEI